MGGPGRELVTTALLTAVVAGALLVQFFRGHRESNFGDVCVTVFGVLYVGWLTGFVIRLRVIPDGARWVFLLLLATWFFDSAAYFWGVNFGRTKLWRKVSPAKTWEGFAGGLVSTVIVVGGVAHLLELFPRMPQLFPGRTTAGFLLLLTPLLCVAAQLGDLAESMIKRTVKIKDSGTFLPGHGGFLDKLDSFLFTSPLVYFAAARIEGLLR